MEKVSGSVWKILCRLDREVVKFEITFAESKRALVRVILAQVMSVAA